MLAKLRKMPRGRRGFYAVRKQIAAEGDSVGVAARLIYLNRFCFNGLYRTNRAGMFNVPYDSSNTGRLPTTAELLDASCALRKCRLAAADFEKALLRCRRGDLVYLDPPYAVKRRRVFSQYHVGGFGIDDLPRLAALLPRLDDLGVSFVMSYAYCAEALAYFSHWPMRRLVVQRNIAGFAGKRRRAAELLISNCFPRGASAS